MEKKITQKEIANTLDNLKKQQLLLQEHYQRINGIKFGDTLAFIFESVIEEYHFTFMQNLKVYSYRVELEKRALKFRTGKLKKKGFTVLKRVYENGFKKVNNMKKIEEVRLIKMQQLIEAKLLRFQKEEIQKMQDKNSLAREFYIFSLKQKSFDSFNNFLDEVYEEREKREKMGEIKYKLNFFKKKLYEAKQQRERQDLPQLQCSKQQRFPIIEEMVEDSYPDLEESTEIQRDHAALPKPIQLVESVKKKKQKGEKTKVEKIKAKKKKKLSFYEKQKIKEEARKKKRLEIEENHRKKRDLKAKQIEEENKRLLLKDKQLRFEKDRKIKQKKEFQRRAKEEKQKQLKHIKDLKLKVINFRESTLKRNYFNYLKTDFERRKNRMAIAKNNWNRKMKIKVLQVIKMIVEDLNLKTKIQNNLKINSFKLNSAILKKKLVFDCFALIRKDYKEKMDSYSTIRDNKLKIMSLSGWKMILKSLKQENFFRRKEQKIKVKTFRRAILIRTTFKAWFKYISSNKKETKKQQKKDHMMSKVQKWILEFDQKKQQK